MSGSLIPLAFFPKMVSRYSVLLAFFILDLYSGHDHCWEIRCQSDSSALCFSFLALSDGGLVSVDLETSPVIYHHSGGLVWKISTHASDFYQTVHQANHGIQGGFCGWCLRSLSDPRLEPLVSQCHLSTHPSLEGWTFQEIAFIYGFSLIPKGIRPSLFDNLWALGQRLGAKGRVWQVSDSSYQSLFHILVETFQIDAFGRTLGRWDSTSDNSI